ncbi:MAG: hypothetical protein ACK4FS_01215 [Flavobacterium sp.]
MIPPYDGPEFLPTKGIETGSLNEYQLYNLVDDIYQKNNLAKSNPQRLDEMKKSFELIRGADFDQIEEIQFKN